MSLRVGSVVLAAVAMGVACRSAHDTGVDAAASAPASAGSASAAASAARSDSGGVAGGGPEVDAGPMAKGVPLPAAVVEEALNPHQAPAYSGPTGSVEGVVHVSGDQAPKRALDIPFACGEAYATYGKAFREGNGRTLADVLVAVTAYDGYIPPRGEVAPVTIHGCAFDKRTIVLEYGQHIEVSNLDTSQYFLPTLLGAEHPAQIVAVPRGDAVRLYPLRVGHYVLADGMDRTWMYADVFVLKYATHAVTGLDGHFRVSGLPVGKAKVSAYLPAIDAALHPDFGIANPTVEREVEIKADKPTIVDFVLPYKTPKKHEEKPKPADTPIIR